MVDARTEAGARELFRAVHGSKGVIAQRLAGEWGVSLQTMYRRVAPFLDSWQHRQARRDAGFTALTDDEAKLIGATWLQSYRANGKRLAKLQAVLDALRASGLIMAGRVDTASGEFFPLSGSQVAKQLRTKGWHPDQLVRPTPKVQLASEHPNHVWQIDPSLCVLYYLSNHTGLQVMDEATFEKNKPANLARIERERVWRYVITDHSSGSVYVEYVFGAESSRNISQCLIHAMQYRGNTDPMHGVPRLLMMDKGSANLGSMFINLCTSLTIETWTNTPGKPWGKGSVEKANDLVEREFEWGLRFVNITTLDELNATCRRWCIAYNATAVHSRHGMTRNAAWMLITAQQLRLAPSVERCMELANSKAEERTVTPLQRISYRGKSYDVSGVPGRRIGEKLLVARNAFGAEDSVQVLGRDDDGQAVWCSLEPIAFGTFGFAETAVPIGEFRTPRETQIDANRKEAERLVMGAATDEEAAAKRKAGALPLGGALQPYQVVADAEATLPAYLPRRGTQAPVHAPATVAVQPHREPTPIRAEIPPMNHADAARALKPLVERAGGTWSAELYQRTVARWPQGLPYDQVEAWAAELARGTRLHVVGGAA